MRFKKINKERVLNKSGQLGKGRVYGTNPIHSASQSIWLPTKNQKL